MPRDSRVYLEDVLTALERIQSYTQGLTRQGFERDTRTVDAVVRNLEVVGEAVKQLPSTVREQAPDIEWSKIAGLRDIVIHAYYSVDLDIIWDVVTHKVPPLAQRIRALLA